MTQAPPQLTTDAENGLHESIASHWYVAWNSHDLDRIVSHYAVDLLFTSPLVRRRLGRDDGSIRDLGSLRAYFATGLASSPNLSFEPVALLHGVGNFTMLYRGAAGRLVAETIWLDAVGKISRANVTYSVAGITNFLVSGQNDMAGPMAR
jgi:hypothetical protein